MNPLPPTNVRLENPDGTTTPLDCVYDGLIEGTHEWIAIVPTNGLHVTPGSIIAVDDLPPHTAIRIDFAQRVRLQPKP